MISVLLIHPWTADIFPPPAIGYLRAALEQHVPNINIHSSYINPRHDWPSHVDYVGVSTHSFTIPAVVNLISDLKKKYPNAKLIAGGHHASALPQQMLDIGFDQIVIGPGENAICDIVAGNTKNLVYGSGNIYYRLPNYSGLDINWGMPVEQGGRGIGIVTSRGCPFECSFCASTNFWHHKWDALAPDQVMDTLEAQIIHYGLNCWMFEDDNFTLKADRAIEICERIKHSKTTRFGTMRWQAAARAESLCSEQLCQHMKDAGCTHVWLGIESLSQKMLDICKKNTHVEAMLHGINIAKSVGLTPVCQFIIGLPGETEETFRDTCDKIKANKIAASTNKAWVLPGTEIHKKAIEYGFKDDAYFTGVPFYEYEWESGTLDRWVTLMKGASQ